MDLLEKMVSWVLEGGRLLMVEREWEEEHFADS
jgi:hypothetical protein